MIMNSALLREQTAFTVVIQLPIEAIAISQ